MAAPLSNSTTPHPPSSASASSSNPSIDPAMAVQPKERGGILFSPSLSSILAAYSQHGNGDSELLKVLLNAKAKEDERLAALDNFRAEQLRVAWYNNQQQHPPHQGGPLSPYASSPSSPPSVLPPWKDAWKDSRPPASFDRPSLPSQSVPSRPPAPFGFYSPSPSYYDTPAPQPHPHELSRPSGSTSFEQQQGSLGRFKRPFSTEVQLQSSINKKPKLNPSLSDEKPSITTAHEDAMSALRAKCERSKAAANATAKNTIISPSSSSASLSLPPLFSDRSPPKNSSPRSRKANTNVPSRPPPRAVAVVSSIRSTSSSPPLNKSPLPSPPASSDGVDGVAGSSLRMLLNAGHVVAQTDAAKEGNSRSASPMTHSF